MNDVTLMINLCAGDAAYAHHTVPALVEAHRGHVAEVVLVVDRIRPAGTRYVPPVPRERFESGLNVVAELAEKWRKDGLADRIIDVTANNREALAAKQRMLGAMKRHHHNARNVAITALAATFMMTERRHVLRYDSDMILHQASGFDWIGEAIGLMQRDERLVAATPRVSPPAFAEGSPEDRPCRGDWGALEVVDGGWAKDWFSMRCMLVDRERLGRYLPLLTSSPYMLAWLAWATATGRGFPLSLERVLSKRLQRAGARCLNLSTRKAWLVHPQPKGERFLRLLPGLLKETAAGRFPLEQAGEIDVQQEAWERHLAQTPGA